MLSFLLFAAMLQPNKTVETCQRPEPGSEVLQPPDVRSQNGRLEITLIFHHEKVAGIDRYCYVDQSGRQTPTLRVRRGDSVALHFLNNADAKLTRSSAMNHAGSRDQDCTGQPRGGEVTNLHFHGMALPPVCHQDDVLHTYISPGAPVYTYSFHIPRDAPSGLYWYHPHVHGFTTQQVVGGASGALIVEGLEEAQPVVRGLHERLLVIRDQNLMHPDAPPSPTEPVVPKQLIEADGDSANSGTGFGKPAKDLSVNFVPVPYPDYPSATLTMLPGRRELWRVLNASAITYLNLAVVVRGIPQKLGLIALDGVPLNADGKIVDSIRWENHLGLPPGSRMEFIVDAPPPDTPAMLVTRTVDTGPGGENDPNRTLAKIRLGAAQVPVLGSSAMQTLPVSAAPWLGDVRPSRVRHFYFSEKLADPENPASAYEFYLTEDGKKPAMFDPAATQPDVTVQSGTVEDWIIENRSNELHDFHIHQLHFLLLEYLGRPVPEPFLRDTVNVPYYNGKTLVYPSVRLRIDFRNPAIVGTFVYHCHILEHEDKGMMGTIRVLAARPAPKRPRHWAYPDPLGRHE
jgi:FtsP/CotA-like multicopper oxidase with cupredoxin domain